MIPRETSTGGDLKRVTHFWEKDKFYFWIWLECGFPVPKTLVRPWGSWLFYNFKSETLSLR